MYERVTPQVLPHELLHYLEAENSLHIEVPNLSDMLAFSSEEKRTKTLSEVRGFKKGRYNC